MDWIRWKVFTSGGGEGLQSHKLVVENNVDWIRWKVFTGGGGEGLLCSSTCFAAVRDLSHLRKENKRLTKWKIDILSHSLVVKGQCPVSFAPAQDHPMSRKSLPRFPIG